MAGSVTDIDRPLPATLQGRAQGSVSRKRKPGTQKFSHWSRATDRKWPPIQFCPTPEPMFGESHARLRSPCVGPTGSSVLPPRAQLMEQALTLNNGVGFDQVWEMVDENSLQNREKRHRQDPALI